MMGERERVLDLIPELVEFGRGGGVRCRGGWGVAPSVPLGMVGWGRAFKSGEKSGLGVKKGFTSRESKLGVGYGERAGSSSSGGGGMKGRDAERRGFFNHAGWKKRSKFHTWLLAGVEHDGEGKSGGREGALRVSQRARGPSRRGGERRLRGVGK